MTTAEARFWSKVERRDNDECWPWTGADDGRGYGQFWMDGKTRRATQVAWSLHFGAPFPDGMMACHTCDNPQCCNPRHIWPGTMSQNMKDASRKGRVDVSTMLSQNANSAKTECKRGHPLEGENLFLDGDGNRRCRTCQREHNKRYQSQPHVKARRAKYEKARRAVLKDGGRE